MIWCLFYVFVLNFVGCLEVNFADSKYTLAHDDQIFATGSPYAIFFDNKWHSTLKLLSKNVKNGNSVISIPGCIILLLRQKSKSQREKSRFEIIFVKFSNNCNPPSKLPKTDNNKAAKRPAKIGDPLRFWKKVLDLLTKISFLKFRFLNHALDKTHFINSKIRKKKSICNNFLAK